MRMPKTLLEDRLVATSEIHDTGRLSGDLISQVGDALNQAEDLGSAATIFIHIVGHTNPDALCAWPGGIDIHSVSRWERVLRRVERANAITVTLVEHACSALALELLLVSDRRLASSDFSVQCARTGKEVWPSMALYRLTREMGASRARKILLEHLKMSAQKAVELQIVDKIVNDEVTDAVCSEYLLHYAVAEGFPVCRRLMQDCLSTDFDDALGTHLAACDRVLRRAAKIECETAANVTPAV